MNQPMRFAAALLALLLAGCSQAPAEPEPEPPVEHAPPEQADVYLYFRVPNSITDAFRFSVNLAAPDGTSQAGEVYSDHPERTRCWTLVDVPLVSDGCCDNPSTTTGDFHCADTSISTYPFSLLENVAFNGTWTIEVERQYSFKNFGGVTGLPGHEGNHCMYVRFSNPGYSFAEGGSSHPESVCKVSGALWFEYGRDWLDQEAARENNASIS